MTSEVCPSMAIALQGQLPGSMQGQVQCSQLMTKMDVESKGKLKKNIRHFKKNVADRQ